MSFTAWALFNRESVNRADLCLELYDWNSVRDTALSKNLHQATRGVENSFQLAVGSYQ